jgi:hypothetical protein
VAQQAAAVTSRAAAYRELKWEDLVPANWNPVAKFKSRNTASLDDGTLRAEALLSEMRALWNNAPTVLALDGATVKIPGYVVPLDEADGKLTEFLLVPYFGACIHTPPPPANQIVLVSMPRGVAGFRAMDTVWVSGRLSNVREDSPMGTSGYRLAAVSVERYQPAP